VAGLGFGFQTWRQNLHGCCRGALTIRIRWVEIELGPRNGAWTKGLFSFGEIAKILQPNLERTLSGEGLRLKLRDPLEFIRRVRDPGLIFDFQCLTNCFAQNLIPTQVLLQPSDLPVIFSPGQLASFSPT
jgi:hypothetical protein